MRFTFAVLIILFSHQMVTSTDVSTLNNASNAHGGIKADSGINADNVLLHNKSLLPVSNHSEDERSDTLDTLMFLLDIVLSEFKEPLTNDQGVINGILGSGKCPKGTTKIGSDCVKDDKPNFD